MADPYLTLPVIARVLRISHRTAYRWAAADTWRRTTGRPRRYHFADAQASYDKHRTDRTMHYLVKRYGDMTRLTERES